MNPLLYALIATFIVSLLSLIGVISLGIKDKLLKKILLLLVAFSAGTLIGSAFLHLIPESVEQSSLSYTSLIVLIGFSFFFVIERFLYWHHCHDGKCDVHTFTYMNLVGDSVHNFIDGMVIAGSYLVSIPLGITTTIAIIAHEIPQELGDFGVLVYGGFKKAKALLFNFMTALTAVLGAIIGYYLSSFTSSFTLFLIPFAAGGFIYIAASDLVPELHKEKNLGKSVISFIFFILGIAFIYTARIIFEH